MPEPDLETRKVLAEFKYPERTFTVFGGEVLGDACASFGGPGSFSFNEPLESDPDAACSLLPRLALALCAQGFDGKQKWASLMRTLRDELEIDHGDCACKCIADAVRELKEADRA